MAWSANYDLYKIEHGKFVWIKGITDPGYTSGIGLYLDDEDDYDYENGKLYETSDGEIVEGSRYDSYKKAINAELNPYGFSLYKNGQDGHGGTGKYQLSETEKVKKIFGFSIYATVEEFDLLDAFRGSKIYTYNLISNRIVPEVTQISVPGAENTDDTDVVIAQSEKETLNGASAPEVSDHVSTGFVIGRETPDAVLSEDGAHIDLYAMAALNWRATQELLERIERLEEAQQ